MGDETSVCTKCGLEKSISSFNPRPDGKVYRCKKCISEYAKAYNSKPEVRAKRNKYSRDNRSIHRAYERTIPKWKKNAQHAKRRASKRNATPPWLTDQHLHKIQMYYRVRSAVEKITGVKQHVDHIVPISSNLVCGLHVPWNLRIIPADENLTKGNRFEWT